MTPQLQKKTTEPEIEVKTRNARVWLDEGGIVRIVSSSDVMETLLEDAEANVAVITKISGGMRRPCFIDARRRKSASRDARMYYVKKFPDVTTAVAILQDSPAVKVFVNFMLGLNKTINQGKFPARLFTSEKEAIEWLKKYIN
jgi:hypothetical protein